MNSNGFSRRWRRDALKPAGDDGSYWLLLIVPQRCAYCAPAVLKRERSQLGSAYRVRRIPSRSSMTVGRHRACQADCASAAAFFSSDVRGGAARMTPLPLTLKSVDWLGVSGFPAAIAAALSAAAADAALAALAAYEGWAWRLEPAEWGDTT